MNRALEIVTRAGHWRTARPTKDPPWTLVLMPTDTLPLPCDREDLAFYLFAYVKFDFEVDHRPGLEGGAKVRTLEYVFSLLLSRSRDDEFISWHWHPNRGDAMGPRKPYPHVHVVGRHAEVGDLRDLHLPSNRVFLEDVLLFAIDDLHIRCREGGRDTLVELLERTRRYASWPGASIGEPMAPRPPRT